MTSNTEKPCKWCAGNGTTNLRILFARTKHNYNVLRMVTDNAELLGYVHASDAHAAIGPCWMCASGNEHLTTISDNERLEEVTPEVLVCCDEETKKSYDNAVAYLSDLKNLCEAYEAVVAEKKVEYEQADTIAFETRSKYRRLKHELELAKQSSLNTKI